MWSGRQAAGLGLDGPVDADDLRALLEGRDPADGAALGSPLVDRTLADGRVVRAVAGFDATFSAPKSLSIWWALTGDPGLLEAHDVAVRATLEHLERFGATTRVRVNGHRQHPDTLGLTVATFQQTTSRADDPQLHTHAVISAKVQTEEGRWMALDARYLKRNQRMLGGLYQSVLRAELTHRYGVAWEQIVNGQAEIAGVPRELVEAFSKRASQVEAELAAKIDQFREREGRDPTRWELAALTREAADGHAGAQDRQRCHGSSDALDGRGRRAGMDGRPVDRRDRGCQPGPNPGGSDHDRGGDRPALHRGFNVDPGRPDAGDLRPPAARVLSVGTQVVGCARGGVRPGDRPLRRSRPAGRARPAEGVGRAFGVDRAHRRAPDQ